MPCHGTNPTHFRANNSDRFFFDHRLKRDFDHFGSFSELRTTRTTQTIATEHLAGFAQLIGNLGPLQVIACQQIFDTSTFCTQRITFSDQFHFFKPAQAAQTHVKNRFGLCLGQCDFWIVPDG